MTEKAATAKQRKCNPYGLTDDEIRQVRYMSNGYHDDEIAKYLHVSRQTVTSRLSRIAFCMEVSGSARGPALRLGIVSRWIREQEQRERP
jgi:DNA-binding CsgD family transcriptional regulator